MKGPPATARFRDPSIGSDQIDCWLNELRPFLLKPVMQTSYIVAWTLSFGVIVTSAFAASPKASVDVADMPDPHGHFGAIHRSAPDKLLRSGAKFEAVSVVPKAQEQCTTNAGGKLKAFVSKGRVSYVDYDPDLLFITDRDGPRAYRMLIHDFPHREISDIRWLAKNCLCFDVLTGPHYGVHYVVDATRPKPLHAAHFHDEFVEEMQRHSQQKPTADTRHR
jgi:hypothetical protein